MIIKRFRCGSLEALVGVEFVMTLREISTNPTVQVSGSLRRIFARSSRAERPAGDGARFATRDLGHGRAHT